MTVGLVVGLAALPVACADNSSESADSFTEFVTLPGQFDTVWELGVQGFVVGTSRNNRVKGPCVSVLASLRLVDGPVAGARFGSSVAAAGVTVVDRESELEMACALEDEMAQAVDERWGTLYTVLPGTTVGVQLSLQLRGDDVPDELAIRFEGESPVTVHPRRLDASPPPIKAVAGDLSVSLEPADTETTYTAAAGGVIEGIHVAGVHVVPVEDHWCVVAYVSGVADFDHYLMNPASIGIVADGVWDASSTAGYCQAFFDDPPEWTSVLTPPGLPAGSRVPLTAAVTFPTKPHVQAILLPSGGPDDWEWVWVEPMIVDSPPPWPS